MFRANLFFSYLFNYYICTCLRKAFCEALVTCAALTLVFEPRNIMIYCFHIWMFLIVRQSGSRKAPF